MTNSSRKPTSGGLALLVHQLAEKENLSAEEAQKWVVDLWSDREGVMSEEFSHLLSEYRAHREWETVFAKLGEWPFDKVSEAGTIPLSEFIKLSVPIKRKSDAQLRFREFLKARERLIGWEDAGEPGELQDFPDISTEGLERLLKRWEDRGVSKTCFLVEGPNVLKWCLEEGARKWAARSEEANKEKKRKSRAGS